MQHLYDPGIVPSAASQCNLRKVHLRSDLTKEQERAWGAYLIQTKQDKGAHAGIEELEPVA